MSFDHILVIVLTFIGMIIPLVGLVLLYFREQNRTTMCLMITNVGALVMNCGYMLLLQSRSYFEAMALYKIMFIGNPLFYVFFIRFIGSFYESKKSYKLMNVVFVMITVLDLATVAAVWNNSENAYRNIEYRLRGTEATSEITENADDDQTIESEDSNTSGSGDTEETSASGSTTRRPAFDPNANGYVYMNVKGGVLYNIRYMVLSGILFLLLIGDVIGFITIKDKSERRRMVYVFFSIILVLSSTMVTLFADLTYDLVPVFSSVTVLVLVLGVVRGNILNVSDAGKMWILKQYEDIFIILDKNYRLIDCNKYAKEAFEELKDTQFGNKVSEKVIDLIENDVKEFEHNDKKYVVRYSPIDVNDKMEGHSLLLMDMTDEVRLRERLQEEKQKAI
ncbi:MAG: hypothetical protein J6Z02_07125, partial [Lachnospiraceae bacterium]|nr:hypothetical protein [Lachnospiraceae bacterium]